MDNLDEYETRMLDLKTETGSCIPNIKVRMTGKPLPEGMSECVKGFIVKKKPSLPPPPPMRKYKSGWFGGEILVNQDEIDEHTAMMEVWREGLQDD